MADMRNAYKMLVGKPERGEDNIGMDFKEANS
jgi:hypothetical protein